MREKRYVFTDSFSRSNQIISSGWTLNQRVVDEFLLQGPANVDLFTTSLICRWPVFFLPSHGSSKRRNRRLSAILDDPSVIVFSPGAALRKVFNRFRDTSNCQLTLIASFWPQKEWFPDLLELCQGNHLPLPISPDLLKLPHFPRIHQNLQSWNLHGWRLELSWLKLPVWTLNSSVDVLFEARTYVPGFLR